jgi:hypothetical protein
MIRRIVFRGTKRTESGPAERFDFEWNVASSGLWVLASEDNLVGKSSILQIALWALRGKPKHLTGTVRDWVEEVEVSFDADGTQVEVAFRVEGQEPVGSVRLTTGSASTEQAFNSTEQFKRTMQDIMLESLALEPIAASRAGPDGLVATHEDGWLAYTGAFLSDTYSDAIIGETIGTDLTQRLLQVYLGLPWATTLFQARSRARQLAAEAEHRRRRMSALGGRSVDELEAELADVQTQISNEGARNQSAKELVEAQREFDRLAELVRRAKRNADDAASDLEDAKVNEIRAGRTLIALRDDRAASLFLHRLAPVCCPRCDRPIGDQRRQMEALERRCSVCTEELPAGDAREMEAYIAEAEARSSEARRFTTDVEGAASDLAHDYTRLRGDLVRAGERVQSAATAGTAADVQVLGRRAARLEGILEVARELTRADKTDENELSILKAAEAEAGDRVSAEAEVVLNSVSSEICRIVTRLGMRDVSQVVLKRNAHVEVHQAARKRKWSDLAPGEQLRLRLATVIALVRSARGRGFGRHPGLLMIDSPGAEEMNAARVGDVLEELNGLVRETEGLQVFVAMQGIEKAAGTVDPTRLRTSGPGELMW